MANFIPEVETVMKSTSLIAILAVVGLQACKSYQRDSSTKGTVYLPLITKDYVAPKNLNSFSLRQVALKQISDNNGFN